MNPAESSLEFVERGSEPRLALRVDPAEGPCSGRVLLVHGFAEHGGRYDELAGLLQRRGLAIARPDLRGHGRSGGARGYCRHFDEYVADLQATLDHLAKDPRFPSTVPLALLGHSMGGLVATRAATRLGERPAGLALSAPFFGVARALSGVERLLGGVAGRIAPGLRQPSGLRGSDLTHDAEIAARYDADPLGFPHVTAGWFLAVTRAQAAALEEAPSLSLPVLCLAAGDDRAVSVAATEAWFRAVGSQEKSLEILPGWFHEILNEPERSRVAGQFADALLLWMAR
ncbi:MAG: lysophospholipase [Deltaproteobacteria bacterium]|nr:lysophospholipase [Deltaproteobacteria bacterium]